MRNNGWVALAIAVGIIVLSIAVHAAFITFVTPDGTVTEGNLFNLDQGNGILITGDDATNTITIATTGSASNLPALPDDNVWVGSAGNVATDTALSDCDLKSEAVTYDTGSNTLGCQFVATSKLTVNSAGGTYTWSIPGYSCPQAALAANFLQNAVAYGMIVPPETTTYTAIGLQVTTAGGGGTVARLGLYEADQTATGYRPGALIVDAGTVSIASTGTKSIAISETLQRGQVYFTAIVHDAAAVSFRMCDTSAIVNGPVTGRSDSPNNTRDRTVIEHMGVGTGALANPASTTTDDVTSTVYGTIVMLSE